MDGRTVRGGNCHTVKQSNPLASSTNKCQSMSYVYVESGRRCNTKDDRNTLTPTSIRTSCSSTVSLACGSAESPVTSSNSPSVWSSHSLSAASCRSNSILWSAIESRRACLASPSDGLVTANETASMPLRDTVTVCEPDADVDTINSTPELAIFNVHHRQPIRSTHCQIYTALRHLTIFGVALSIGVVRIFAGGHSVVA